MSKLIGAGQQVRQDFLFDASGTITIGGTAQLLLPQHPSRSLFMFVNNSAHTMYLDFGVGAGPAYVYATLTGRAVTSVTVINAGFNFTQPPLVRFLGGGHPVATLQSGQPAGVNSSYVATAGPGFPSPRGGLAATGGQGHEATAMANLTSSAISLNKIGSITVLNAGSYSAAPYVMLLPSDLDPNGVVIPGSTYPGSIAVLANGSVQFLATDCPTDACSVVSSGTADSFTCKFMT